MNTRVREGIEAATVWFPQRGGQGVLVPGSLIVTAAHVVAWSAEGDMALGDRYVEKVRLRDGRILTIETKAVEPVADIAVLGAPDDDNLQHYIAFEDFCATTPPVPICTADFRLFEPFPVHILTHQGHWVSARAQQCNVNAPTLSVEACEGIMGGTSGGPVVTDDGLLLGVVSEFGGTDEEAGCDGSVPRLHLAGPGWLVRRMIDPERYGIV